MEAYKSGERGPFDAWPIKKPMRLTVAYDDPAQETERVRRLDEMLDFAEAAEGLAREYSG